MHGQLKLNFEREANRTSCRVIAQQPPLQIVRSFDIADGGALVHLHNVSGGVLGGDLLETEIEVGPEAYAQLTTTSATRLYRPRTEASPACQKLGVTIGRGGRLEYLPDPLIAFTGSRYHQETTIELADGAGLFWWETLAPGRVAMGERFQYDELRLNLILQTANRPLAIERVRLAPAEQRLNNLLQLGGYDYLTTLYICRVGQPPQKWLELETELTELARELSQPGASWWGVSTLVADGLIVRGLGATSRDTGPGLLRFWQTAKQALYGQDAHPPRKVY